MAFARSSTTEPKIHDEMRKRSHRVFVNGDLNLNIIFVRQTLDTTNKFDDLHIVTWKENGVWWEWIAPCTTKPGVKAVADPGNPVGVARVKAGQFSSAMTFGRHHDEYRCLVQCVPLPLWRDRNRDGTPDYEIAPVMQKAHIHIHKAGSSSTIVDHWSEGCLVDAKASDFAEFMKICDKSAEKYGDKFTFSVLEGFKYEYR